MRKLALGLLGVVLGSAWFLLWLIDEPGQRRRALARASKRAAVTQDAASWDENRRLVKAARR